jgi:hypothetical protein
MRYGDVKILKDTIISNNIRPILIKEKMLLCSHLKEFIAKYNINHLI